MKASRSEILRAVLVVALLALTFVQACQEEVEVPIIEFGKSVVSAGEGAQVVITVSLGPGPHSSGYLGISVAGNAVQDVDFTTDPAIDDGLLEVDIPEDGTSLQITLTTLDNTHFDEDRIIVFTMQATPGFQLGSKQSLTVVINDDEGPSIATFEKDQDTLLETDALGILVRIPFSQPAKGEGTITITYTASEATYGTDYLISPIPDGTSLVLNVQPGDTEATFAILPVHNFNFTSNVQVQLAISAVSGAVRKGTGLTFTLTIVNTDEESLVNFASESGLLNENNGAGVEISIPFTASAPGEGSITITMTSSNASYATDFTTVPAVAGNQVITLNVSPGQTSASFTVLPTNNLNCYGNKSILFKIAFANGSVKKGTALEYTQQLVDDDQISVASFAATSGQVDENNGSGVAIQILFSNPTSSAGQLFIYDPVWQNSPNKYTAQPSMMDDYYGGQYTVVQVSVNSTQAEFHVFPTNNTSNDPNYIVVFDMYGTSSSGCLTGGGVHALTIVDDE